MDTHFQIFLQIRVRTQAPGDAVAVEQLRHVRDGRVDFGERQKRHQVPAVRRDDDQNHQPPGADDDASAVRSRQIHATFWKMWQNKQIIDFVVVVD